MSFSMNILYRGENGNAAAFAREMQESGTAERIRKFRGCLGYEYFISLSDPETVLLIDRWEDQKALDTYHASPIMAEVAALREKYDPLEIDRSSENDSALRHQIRCQRIIESSAAISS